MDMCVHVLFHKETVILSESIFLTFPEIEREIFLNFS